MTENIKLQFVDTNILLYAYDTQSGEKFKIANRLLKDLWNHREGCISLQVLQEFYVNILRKTRKPLTKEEAKQAVKDFSEWTIHRPAIDDIFAAIDLSDRYQISFWDSLVINSAQQTGCKILWSEDLGNGQDYDGVMVRNPFHA